MKRLPLIIFVALSATGCQKKDNPTQPAVSSIPTPLAASTTQAVYAIEGQSNSAYMGQQQSEYIRQRLGAVAVVNCGVPSTRMVTWTKGGGYYDACIVQINQALASNPGSSLKGILFWQGESDCNAAEIDQWVSRFRAFVEGMRGVYGGSLPIAYAQITDTHTELRDEMRSYQAGVYIPGVDMIRTDGIVQSGDHTDSDGYLIMANRFIQDLKAR